MRTRFLALLISPPAHGRAFSIFIVLGLCFIIAVVYVAARGAFGNLALNILPLILAVSWLGLGWGVAVSILITLLRAAGDATTAWINPNYYVVGAELTRLVSNRISGLLMFLCIAYVIHELILLSRQLEERVQARTTALGKATESRERLQRHLLAAGARERAAIGHDLHDGLGQHLTATAMAASILSSRLAERGDALAAPAREIEGLVKSGIDQTRRIARGLLLENVPPDQLIGELDELVVSSTAGFSTPCSLTTAGPVETLDSVISSHVYYIAREALRNALRHAAPSRVDLHLAVTPGQVELSVTDDGTGLGDRDEGESDGVGLHIMSQRAEILGGSLSLISPAPSGTGTRIKCRVPLAVPAATT